VKKPKQLTDLPNIGKATAADLLSIGIHSPSQLIGRDPLATFHELAAVIGQRHDPCVLYMLMAVQHYLSGGVSLPWWEFASEGKKLLAANSKRPQA